jgi:hypothetical protein
VVLEEREGLLGTSFTRKAFCGPEMGHHEDMWWGGMLHLCLHLHLELYLRISCGQVNKYSNIIQPVVSLPVLSFLLS